MTPSLEEPIEAIRTSTVADLSSREQEDLAEEGERLYRRLMNSRNYDHPFGFGKLLYRPNNFSRRCTVELHRLIRTSICDGTDCLPQKLLRRGGGYA